jgi:HlyD family secretion protein
MSKKLIWIIVSLVLLIVVLVGLKKAGVFGKDEGTKVSAEKVIKRTIIETVNASGKIYPEVEVKVSPDISGEIVELNVEEGDSVSRGQVLARIYADIYSSQRDQTAAGVSQAKAGVSNSAAQLEALKATLEQAENNFNRQKKLLEDKVISRAEFEQAEQQLKTARANYNAAKEGIKGNEASVQSALAQLTRANKDLSRATIVAPMSGVVSLLNIKKGERVAGNSFNVGTEMMRIADMSAIEVRVEVGENDIPKVKLGDSALVEVDAYSKRKFKGIVSKIGSSSTSAAQQISSSTGTEVSNYKVHIRLLPASYQDLMVVVNGKKRFPFRPGMNASADIQTTTHKDVLSVPINAVTTREKDSDKAVDKSAVAAQNDNQGEEKSSTPEDIDEVVFVLQKDGTVKKAKVRTDIQDINYIEVLGGLKENDEVITGPYSLVSKTLKEGQKVKVVPKEKLFDDKIKKE